MNVHILQGVPYWKNDANELFLYTSNPPIKIGSMTATKEVQLLPDWKELSKEFLELYRKNLKISTVEKIQKSKSM